MRRAHHARDPMMFARIARVHRCLGALARTLRAGSPCAKHESESVTGWERRCARVSSPMRQNLEGDHDKAQTRLRAKHDQLLEEG